MYLKISGHKNKFYKHDFGWVIDGSVLSTQTVN